MTKTNAVTSPTAKTKNSRIAAYTCLVPFERQSFKAALENREKADRRLESAFQKTVFSEQDKRFISAMVYGVLRHWFQLNVMMTWGLARFSAIGTLPSPSEQKQRLKALDMKARLILRLGLFQMFWADSVPDYAVISSSLELADKLKLPAGLKKQIHAILANAANESTYAELKNRLSQGEIPLWPQEWQQTLQAGFGAEAIQDMMASCGQPPEGFWIRVNTLRCEPQVYQKQLQDAGIAFTVSPDLPECLWLEHYQGSPARLPGFSDGLVYIQDISSAKASILVGPRPGETIVDMCAAPGSKTTHMAALMQNQGRIIALESSEKRIAQLQENCLRLGVSNVEAIVADALLWQAPGNISIDRVLVDAPCSGSGTIRHQPDGLLQWRSGQAEAYRQTQFALLEKAASVLKSGGVLVYSTCSLDPAENEGTLQQFITAYPSWECLKTDVSPITNRQDGFFTALLKKP